MAGDYSETGSRETGVGRKDKRKRKTKNEETRPPCSLARSHIFSRSFSVFVPGFSFFVLRFSFVFSSVCRLPSTVSLVRLVLDARLLRGLDPLPGLKEEEI